MQKQNKNITMAENHLTPYQKRLLGEIRKLQEYVIIHKEEEIQSAIEPARNVLLRMSKEALIKTAILQEYLWIDELLKGEINSYLFYKKPSIKHRKKILIEYMIDKLGYSEKYDLFRKIAKPRQYILEYLKTINRLRNVVTHYYSPQHEVKKVKKRILYKGNNIFNITTFKKFWDESIEVSNYFISRLIRS